MASCLSGFAFVAKFAYSANELQAIDMDRGFFWHQHDCRIGAEQPLSNQHYWLPKLARNVERDEMAGKQLVHEGWEVLVVWECQTRKTAELQQLVASFLTGAASRPE